MGLEELPIVSMGQARYIIRKLKKDVSSLRLVCINILQIIELVDKAGENISCGEKEDIKKQLREVLDNTHDGSTDNQP